MKVLHIIDSLGLGGAQTIVKGIVEHSEQPDDHFVFALRQRDITTEIHHPQITIFLSPKKYSFAPINQLKKLIQEKNITILHCHLFRSVVFGYILKRFYFPHLTLIVHEHGHIFRDDRYYNFFLNKTQSLIDSFIAISQATSHHLQSKAGIPDSKIHLLYNFVDLKRFNRQEITNASEIRERYNVPSDGFVVGFAGRLKKMKGWREFVQAALITAKNHPEIHFLIAGDGEDRIDLETVISDSNNIHYIGYQSDIPTFYASLDCFVISSYWEAMGLTEIEAQAMNVPVVASDVPALNEIVQNGENALLFESKNVEDLASKIELLFNNPDLRDTLSQKGFLNAQIYSLTEYIVNLGSLYQK